MMKRRLSIVLVFLTLFVLASSEGFASGGSQPVGFPVVSPAASTQTCTERFSDNFDRSNRNLNGDNGWSVASGSYAISSNQLSSTSANSAAHQATTLSAAIQYARFDIVTLSSDSAAGALLATDTSAYTEYYIIGGAVDATYWYDTAGIVQSTTGFTWANGNNFAVMRSPSGNNTIISIWKNTSNSTPWSGGGQCTADPTKPCWDNANDPPDIQFTNNPSNAADSFFGFGVQGGYLSGNVIDNFSAGDCSE